VPRPLRRGRGLNTLILGWSSLARRRVLPALRRIGATRVDIASRAGSIDPSAAAGGRTFTSYDEALRTSDADVVYVSTRNHEHVEWTRAALESGRHTIVDKPAALSVDESEDLVALARSRGRLLAEANVWAWHPQIEAVRALIDARGPVTRLSATFVFPWIARPNYRYEAACGGGALWDLGAYAVSCGRVLFGAAPDETAATIVKPAGEEVETAFSVLMRYPGDRTVIGHFGMPFPYINRIECLGPALSATIERAFTTPADAPVRIVDSSGGAPAAIEVPAADAFAHFLAGVRDAIATGGYDRFGDMLIADARALAQLCRAARPIP
jgi:predicted dehydrogenase